MSARNLRGSPRVTSCIECAQGMQALGDRQSCDLADMFVQAENIPGFQSYNARIAECSNATVHLCCALDEIWTGMVKSVKALRVPTSNVPGR